MKLSSHWFKRSRQSTDSCSVEIAFLPILPDWSSLELLSCCTFMELIQGSSLQLAFGNVAEFRDGGEEQDEQDEASISYQQSYPLSPASTPPYLEKSDIGGR